MAYIGNGKSGIYAIGGLTTSPMATSWLDPSLRWRRAQTTGFMRNWTSNTDAKRPMPIKGVVVPPPSGGAVLRTLMGVGLEILLAVLMLRRTT